MKRTVIETVTKGEIKQMIKDENKRIYEMLTKMNIRINDLDRLWKRE